MAGETMDVLHGELIAAGYKDVKMVDGGFDALKEAGIETAKGGSGVKAVDVKIDSIDTTHVINTDELKANYDDYKVVDVRADEEYVVDIYGEAKGGHLPERFILLHRLISESWYVKRVMQSYKKCLKMQVQKDDIGCNMAAQPESDLVICS